MYVRVQVKPGAKKEVFLPMSEDSFDIAVRVPAERNMANKRVLELLAQHFKLPSGRLRIISGHHSRVKLISITEKI